MGFIRLGSDGTTSRAVSQFQAHGRDRPCGLIAVEGVFMGRIVESPGYAKRHPMTE